MCGLHLRTPRALVPACALAGPCPPWVPYLPKPEGGELLLDPFHRGTGEVDVTELLDKHADEEVYAVRVDTKIAQVNGDLPVPC